MGLFTPAPPLTFRFGSSTDGQAFQLVAGVAVTKAAQETVAFPPVTARYFRLHIQPAAPSPVMMGDFEPEPGADPGFFGAPMGSPKTDAEINELTSTRLPA